MAVDQPPQKTSAFDKMIEQIHNTRLYQKLFIIVFNFLLVVMAGWFSWNILLCLAAPDHWCHVPGQNETNLTLEEWKSITIPKEVNSHGILSYSSCTRYKTLQNQLNNDTIHPIDNKDELINCDNKWEYNTTWYDATLVTQNNWVCDNVMVPTNILAFGKVGEVLGTLIFAYLGDTYGRKPVLFLSLFFVCLGRSLATVTSSSLFLFHIFNFISWMPGLAAYQGAIIISMEISRPEDRAWISMAQCLGWSTGLITMPLFMWWLRDWVPFVLTTTLPCLLFFFSMPWMVESPRWLASKGKIKECYKELKKISVINNAEMPQNAIEVLEDTFNLQGNDKSYTLLDLFSSFRLAKNTILLVVAWCIQTMIYNSLAYNINNLSGHPFLNYMTQSIAEFPAFLIGTYISDYFGRRWASVSSFAFSLLVYIPAIFIINDPAQETVINCLHGFMRFSISIAYYSLNLQCMEIFPTCVRQTGVSFASVVGCIVGVLVPYIVTLGQTTDAILLYLINCCLALVGVISCFFLPETFGHHLPGTLEDAANFGADQDMWGKTKIKDVHNAEVMIPLKT